MLIDKIDSTKAVPILNKGSLAGIPLRQLAASVGHDVRTHMNHYGQWTVEAGLDAALGAANAKLIAQDES